MRELDAFVREPDRLLSRPVFSSGPAACTAPRVTDRRRSRGAGALYRLTEPNMGIIVPIMGTRKTTRQRAPIRIGGIADALFSKGQQRVLGVLFGNPTRSFYANEIIARTGAGTGAGNPRTYASMTPCIALARLHKFSDDRCNASSRAAQAHFV